MNVDSQPFQGGADTLTYPELISQALIIPVIGGHLIIELTLLLLVHGKEAYSLIEL
jgi:hypothetical protein